LPLTNEKTTFLYKVELLLNVCFNTMIMAQLKISRESLKQIL